MSNHDILSLSTECTDCGEPSAVIDLEAYGPGKPAAYCACCFIANHAPGVDAPVYTSVYGEMAEVTTLLDSDTCDNCGVAVTGSIKHGEDFLKADAEWDAWLLTEASINHPQSRYEAHLAEWVTTRPDEWSEAQRRHVNEIVFGLDAHA